VGGYSWLRLRGRAWSWPLAAGLGAAGTVAARLFVPQPVGMANNGDAQRLICQIGGDADAAPALTAKWAYVRLDYPVKHLASACEQYPTTHFLQVGLTSWVHRHVLGLSGVLDVRELMAEYCLLVGLVIAAVAWLLRSIRPLARVAVLVALFLVLSEATFADYAGSPYSEAAAHYGILMLAVAAVVAVRAGRLSRIAYLVAWAAAVLAVGAKNETITLAVPLGLLLASRRFEAGRLRGPFGSRLVPLLCLLSLAFTAGWNLANEPAADHEVNFANELTMTLMPVSGDPGQVAVDLGLPRSFGRYGGTNWWSPHPVEQDPLFPRYKSRFSQPVLARYLATHPVLATRVLSGGAAAYLAFRNSYVGTYPMDAGYAPQAQECRDCVLMDISHAMRWSGFPGILLYWSACAAGAVWLVRTSRPATLRRGFALVTLTLLGCTLVQYATAVFGEGNEVTKHMSVALFAAALAPVWIAAGALQERAQSTAADVPTLRPARAPRLLAGRTANPSVDS
jgi:hypothetical protein